MQGGARVVWGRRGEGGGGNGLVTWEFGLKVERVEYKWHGALYTINTSLTKSKNHDF